jgi:hypothetical protein
MVVLTHFSKRAFPLIQSSLFMLIGFLLGKITIYFSQLQIFSDFFGKMHDFWFFITIFAESFRLKHHTNYIISKET